MGEMMKVTVTVEGLKELDAALSELEKRTTRKAVARRVLRMAAEPIRDDASRLAPDDPRTPPIDLHTGIAISSRQKGGRAMRLTKSGPNWVDVYVGPSTKTPRYAHAIVQEFGSVNQSPQPYMRPAFDRNKKKALDIIKSNLGKEIDKAAKRAARKALKLKGK